MPNLRITKKKSPALSDRRFQTVEKVILAKSGVLNPSTSAQAKDNIAWVTANFKKQSRSAQPHYARIMRCAQNASGAERGWLVQRESNAAQQRKGDQVKSFDQPLKEKWCGVALGAARF